jgi:hypothetical protein
MIIEKYYMVSMSCDIWSTAASLTFDQTPDILRHLDFTAEVQTGRLL